MKLKELCLFLQGQVFVNMSNGNLRKYEDYEDKII